MGPARDSWQPLSPELPRSRPETEQPWTSRLADVSPARVAAANPLLPVLGAVAAPAHAIQSAPQTPRMADALQQVHINSPRAASCADAVGNYICCPVGSLLDKVVDAIGQPCTWSNPVPQPPEPSSSC